MKKDYPRAPNLRLRRRDSIFTPLQAISDKKSSLYYKLSSDRAFLIVGETLPSNVGKPLQAISHEKSNCYHNLAFLIVGKTLHKTFQAKPTSSEKTIYISVLSI